MPAKNVIKLRTGTGTPAAASFAASEPAWDSTNALLYVKSAAGAMVPIGAIPFATTAQFPATGVSPTLYIATDTGRIYRWAGTAYAEVGSIAGVAGAPNRAVVDLGQPLGPVSTLTVSPPADAYDGVVVVTVGFNMTFTLSSPTGLTSFRLIIKQTSTGGSVVTFSSTNITWADGLQPNVNINANTFAVYRFLWTGSTYLAWIEGQPQDAFSIYTVR